MKYMINELLKDYKEKLKNHNIDGREARLLLAYALNVDSNDIIKFDEINEEKFKAFEDAVNKRISGVPYAYITGHKEFMKLNFKVDENVLIPRPETEILVEEALKINAKNVLDMCTGSGCIAISIAYYNKEAKVTGTDISKQAIELAKENALNNGVNIKFVNSNLFEDIDEKYDLIVSNPPYIKTDIINTLNIEVRNEPIIALDGGEDGLLFYRKIAEEARNHLTANGYLLFEIGFDQGQEVMNILKKNNYKNIMIKKDYSGNDRIICSNI